MIKIYIDAATNQNKQLSAGGMIIIKDKKQKQLSYPLSAKTNNEAEFEMFLLALTHCLDQDWEDEMIFLYTDSRIVTESIRKEYAKDARFTQHLSLILDLIPKLNSLFIEWIEEKDNKGADNLARQGLQKRYSD
ncbi:ribonuclease HI family protein [Vagococcus fluvialis]|uniref:ribonuclease HI family protein n=1 Tax=Vagococcus fluvialis TaxID=2738 RepID=UPI003B5C03E5